MVEKVYNAYLEALLKGDRRSCQAMIEDLVAGGVDIRDIYLQLFQQSLYQVGELWETNRISVATEHLATAMTEGLMATLYPQIFSASHIDKTAVVTCTANEYHQIGGKMVADIFELNGWDSHFLGANTPVDDLLLFIGEKHPDVLALSLSIYSNLPKLLRTLDVVRENYRHLDILCGGQAFRWGGREDVEKIQGTQLISSITALENIIKS